MGSILQTSPAAEAPSRTTLREVARRAGLSVGTVSRILNGGNKGVWKSTAEREESVRRIADELGYKPNFSARSLRNQKAHTVALVYGQSTPMLYGAYETIASSIVGILEPYHYHLLFLPLPPSSIDHWPLDLLSNGRVDGCIGMDPLPEVVVDTLQRSGLPFVAINTEKSVPCVRPDDVGGTRLSLDHLTAIGHRRIAFYAGQHPHGIHFSLPVRRHAYQLEMRQRGLGEYATTIEDEMPNFVARFVNTPPSQRPTALLVYQASQALPLQKMLLQAGIRIPQDLSLMTFDDLPALQWLTPAMTAIDVPMSTLGERAAERLLGRLEHGQDLEPGATLIPERLIFRESTAPPA
jgi:DNA-binding LacI/PurR family transcriptional regulator